MCVHLPELAKAVFIPVGRQDFWSGPFCPMLSIELTTEPKASLWRIFKPKFPSYLHILVLIVVRCHGVRHFPLKEQLQGKP